MGKYHGAVKVLDAVSVSVASGTSMGILGPNGVGKTTLLRILAGIDQPDEGHVTLLPPTTTVGYLAQERETTDETLATYLARRTGVAAAEAALEEASGALGAGKGGSGEPLQHLAGALPGTRGGRFEKARAESVLAELALPAKLLQLPMSHLSGGQGAKAALAALLLSRFDIALLDEPTNDLDFDGLERLEAFLDRRQGGLVVVSHDRAFLERIVTSIGEIDLGTHRMSVYEGGWSAYLDARATAQHHAVEARLGYEAERARLVARAGQQRQWAVTGVARASKRPKDNDSAQRGFRVNRTEKQASKVRASERALERLAPVDKPFEPWKLRLEIAASHRSGDVVAVLEGAVARRGEWTLGPVDLSVGWGDHLGILGRNGSGKTTLLSMILGRLPLEAGTRWIGPGVVFGGAQPGQGTLRSRSALISGFLEVTGMKTAEGRSLLAKIRARLGRGRAGFRLLVPR